MRGRGRVRARVWVRGRGRVRVRVRVMLTKLEKYEEDQAWLLRRKPDATDEQLEEFAYKVAELVCDAEYSETEARVKALKLMANNG